MWEKVLSHPLHFTVSAVKWPFHLSEMFSDSSDSFIKLNIPWHSSIDSVILTSSSRNFLLTIYVDSIKYIFQVAIL